MSDPNTTKLLVDIYSKSPELFSLDQVDALKQQADEAGIPFRRNLDTDEEQIAEIPKQLLGGFIQGVTAFIDPFDKPRNFTGEVAHELGNLSGFVGSVFG